MLIKQIKQKLNTRKLKAGLMVTVLLINSVGLLLVAQVNNVEAAWHSPAWSFRKRITLGTISATLSDYQLEIQDINTQALYNEGKLNYDCSDLRFTDSRGILLDYWIEENGTNCSSDTATDIWVRIPRSEAAGTYLYMYYGNKSADSYSNGSKTFEFFDNFDYQTNVNWYSASWAKRLKLTIDQERIDADLTDFPVYLDLGLLSQDFFANVQSDGGDIIVTASDGTTKLERELVSLSVSDRSGELWFKAPQVNANSDTVFYIYFANGSANETNSSATWNSGFAWVEHMNEDPSAAAPQLQDSTVNANNGTSSGSMTATDLVQAKIGRGIEFDGSNDEIQIPNSTSLNINGSGSQFTISSWVKLGSNIVDWDTVLFKGDGAADCSTGCTNRQYSMFINVDRYTHFVSTPTGASIQTQVQTNPGTFKTNSWVKYDFVVNSSTQSIKTYINGVLLSSGTYSSAGIKSATGILRIANSGPNSNHYLQGIIDETRISNTERSAAWLKAEYYNQENPQSFLRVESDLANSQNNQGVDYLAKWQLKGTPQFAAGSVTLTGVSENDRITSIMQFGNGYQSVFRIGQSSNSLANGWAGVSNAASSGSFFSDDAAGVIFDGTTGGNFERGTSNEGTITAAAGTVAEATGYATHKITSVAGSINFFINDTANGTVATNTPNENMSLVFDTDSASDSLTLDWVAIAKYSANYAPTVTLGSEEYTDGPVLSYTFDYIQGQEVLNSGTDKSLTATLGRTGAQADDDPTITTGCFKGSCLEFNGSSNLLEIPASASLDLQRFTISAWMNINNLNSNMFVFEKSSTNAVNTQYSCFLATGVIYFRTVNASNTTHDLSVAVSSTSLAAKSWNNIACVYDGATKKIYINGIEVASVAYTQTLKTGPTGRSRIGAHLTDAYYFFGRLDEVKVFPRALSASEIRADLANEPNMLGENTAQPGLIADLRFDEATTTRVYDHSGLDNSPTISGTPAYVAGYSDQSMDFNSTDDYLTYSSGLEIDRDYTITTRFSYPLASTSAWNTLVRGSNDHHLIVRRSDMQLGLYDNLTATEFNGCGFIMSTLTNGWHHLAMVANGSRTTFYIDNREVCFVARVSYQNIIAVGNYQGGAQNFGNIDNFRVYDKALTPSQVEADYNNNLISRKPGALSSWSLDESYGVVARDRGSKKLDASLINTDQADWTSGKFNSGLTCNGSDEYLSVSNQIYPLSQGSLSFWVNYPTVNTMTITGSYGGSGNQRAPTFSINSSGELIWEFGSLTNQDNNAVLTTNAWHHIVMTYDNVYNVRVYLDGDLIGTGISSDPLDFYDQVTFCKYASSAVYFAGSIDEIQIYGYTLQANDILALYNRNTSKAQTPVTENSSTFVNYKMDESSWTGAAGGVLDAVGVVNATANGGVSTTSNSKFGRAGDFDGVNDYLSVPGLGSSLTGLNALTISTWINLHSNSNDDYPIIFGSADSGNNTTTAMQFHVLGPVYGANQGKLVFYLNSTCFAFTSSAIALNDWLHLAAVYDAGNTKIYINGELSGSASGCPSTIGAFTNGVIGGAATANNNVDGYLDDFRIYSRALDISEIQFVNESNQNLAVGSNPLPAKVLSLNLDEKSGLTAKNETGIGNATLVNTENSDWIKGKVGNALSFDGVNEYAQLADNNAYEGGTTKTISLWIKPTSIGGTYKMILEKGDTNLAGGSPFFVVLCSDGRIGGIAWDANNSTLNGFGSSTVLSAGNWYHIALVIDTTQATATNEVAMYINGERQTRTIANCQANTSGNLSTLRSNSLPLYLGVRDTSGVKNNYFDGAIDNVRIYSAALSAREVAFDYNGGLPSRYYRFDHENGTVSYDYSGNSFNGTNTNMDNTVWMSGSNCKNNECINLDGSNDYVNIGVPGTVGAMSFWLRPDTVGADRRIIGNVAGGTGGFALRFDGVGIEVWNGSSWQQCTDAVSTTVWSHLVINFNGSAYTCYLNGRQGYSGTAGAFGQQLGLGARFLLSFGSYYDGRFDEFKIFTYMLSQADIAREYNSYGAALRLE